MATRRGKKAEPEIPRLALEQLSSAEAIGGVEGPGRWLVIRYTPSALFSLKMSSATSTVGKSLLIPTMYSVKMAFLDVALRRYERAAASEFVSVLRMGDLRIGPPERAVVTHTIVKIRQEPKQPKPDMPYGSAVAFREFVAYAGDIKVAFDLSTLTARCAEWLVGLAPCINYFGKRGSLMQFTGMERAECLDHRFTQAVSVMDLSVPGRAHIAYLDDFGPEATLDVLDSYREESIKRDKHRKFVECVIPLGVANAGPGFTEYELAEQR